MATQLITAETGASISINYPDSVSATAIQLAIPPAVRVLNELIRSGYSLHNTLHRMKIESEVEKAFRREWSKVMRQDVIPVVGTARAYQDGYDMLNSMKLDRPLREQAEAELKRKLARRWG